MNPGEADSNTIDWTQVERAVVQELLERAKQVARQIEERVKKVTGDTDQAQKLGPDDPTDESPKVVG